jgi:hypothetical protein
MRILVKAIGHKNMSIRFIKIDFQHYTPFFKSFRAVYIDRLET